jgi:quercetin dioxygenase-like cupin family protein
MLDRPHTEFVQAQMLPWRRIPPGRGRPDAEYTFLSRDAGDGACSCLIRYHPGWHREADETLTATEEFYVLEGRLELDGVAYGPDTYACLPAGWPRRRMHTPAGAVVLSFFDRQPDPLPLDARAAAAAPSVHLHSRAVPHLDVLHMPWDRQLNDPKLAHLGIARKDLRTDPATGERTFLSMILPHSEPPGARGPTETHPTVEEAYVIAGSLVGPHGAMHPGAYFWRPPGIAHGPFGTRWGCVALIRFLGGRHVNEWSREERPFAFDAPYDPVLPHELEHLRATPWQPPGVY